MFEDTPGLDADTSHSAELPGLRDADVVIAVLGEQRQTTELEVALLCRLMSRVRYRLVVVRVGRAASTEARLESERAVSDLLARQRLTTIGPVLVIDDLPPSAQPPEGVCSLRM